MDFKGPVSWRLYNEDQLCLLRRLIPGDLNKPSSEPRFGGRLLWFLSLFCKQARNKDHLLNKSGNPFSMIHLPHLF